MFYSFGQLRRNCTWFWGGNLQKFTDAKPVSVFLSTTKYDYIGTLPWNFEIENCSLNTLLLTCDNMDYSNKLSIAVGPNTPNWDWEVPQSLCSGIGKDYPFPQKVDNLNRQEKQRVGGKSIIFLHKGNWDSMIKMTQVIYGRAGNWTQISWVPLTSALTTN